MKVFWICIGLFAVYVLCEIDMRVNYYIQNAYDEYRAEKSLHQTLGNFTFNSEITKSNCYLFRTLR
jgi:hypothetical protein